jgi:hypothetical protein
MEYVGKVQRLAHAMTSIKLQKISLKVGTPNSASDLLIATVFYTHNQGFFFPYFGSSQIGNETSFFVARVATNVIFICIFLSFSSRM